MMTGKPRVGLIIGNAHGGSTITNIVIGQHDKVFSAGAMRGFPGNGQLASDNTCSCGEAAPACPFWSRVKQGTEGIQSLRARDQALFSSILETSSAECVVDVDHGLGRLIELTANPGVNMRVLYVNRSLRGVIHSQVRKSIERGEFKTPVVDFLKLCLKVGRGWASKPRVLPRFCDLHGIAHIAVDYERLCADPETELNRIGRLLGLDYSEVGTRIARDRLLTMPEHLIRGNQKLRRNKTITLRLDESWHNKRGYASVLFAALGAAFGMLEARLLMARKLRRMNKRIERIS